MNIDEVNELINQFETMPTAEAIKYCAAIGFSIEETASQVDIDPATIENPGGLRLEWEAGRNFFIRSLRAAQIDRALAGDADLLIHLGQVYLGQSEPVEELDEGPQVTPEELNARIAEICAKYK